MNFRNRENRIRLRSYHGMGPEQKLAHAVQKKGSNAFTSNLVALKDQINYLRLTIPEFRHSSNLMLNLLIQKAHIVNLHHEHDHRGKKLQDEYVFQDSLKIDFVFALQGNFELVYKVVKIRDPKCVARQIEDSINPTKSFKSNNSNFITSSKTLQQHAIAKFSEVEENHGLFAIDYAQVKFNKGQSMSQYTLDDFRIKDFDQYFLDRLKQVTEKDEDSETDTSTDPVLREQDSGSDQSAKSSTRPTTLQPTTNNQNEFIEYEDKLVKLRLMSKTGVLFVVPYNAYKSVLESFGQDEERAHRWIKRALPSLSQQTTTVMNKVIRSFEEVHFPKGAPIVKEGQQLGNFYLLCEGEVRLEARNNPFTKVDYEQYDCNHFTAARAVNNSNGYGNLSKTIGGNQIGIVSPGVFLGEEQHLLEMPSIYSAFANTPNIKMLKISRADFENLIPSSIHDKMREAIWPKMEWMRERLNQLHITREQINGLDQQTKQLPQTVAHIQNIYPLSTQSTQHKLRRGILQENGNSSGLLLFCDAGRPEREREKQKQDQGTGDIQGIRQRLFNKASKAQRQKLRAISNSATIPTFDSESDEDSQSASKTLAISPLRSGSISPLRRVNDICSVATTSRTLLKDLPNSNSKGSLLLPDLKSRAEVSIALTPSEFPETSTLEKTSNTMYMAIEPALQEETIDQSLLRVEQNPTPLSNNAPSQLRSFKSNSKRGRNMSMNLTPQLSRGKLMGKEVTEQDQARSSFHSRATSIDKAGVQPLRIYTNMSNGLPSLTHRSKQQTISFSTAFVRANSVLRPADMVKMQHKQDTLPSYTRHKRLQKSVFENRILKSPVRSNLQSLRTSNVSQEVNKVFTDMGSDSRLSPQQARKLNEEFTTVKAQKGRFNFDGQISFLDKVIKQEALFAKKKTAYTKDSQKDLMAALR